MMARAIFLQNGTSIAEFPIKIDGPGDLGDGAKKAFAEFRSQFPKLSLLDHGMVVRFAKMEEPSMGGARPARARKRKK